MKERTIAKARNTLAAIAVVLLLVLTAVFLPGAVHARADQTLNRTDSGEFSATDWTKSNDNGAAVVESDAATEASIAYGERLTGAYTVEVAYYTIPHDYGDMNVVLGALTADVVDNTFLTDTNKVILSKNAWALSTYPADYTVYEADGETAAGNVISDVFGTNWGGRTLYRMKFAVQSNGNLNIYFGRTDEEMETLRCVITFGGDNSEFAVTDGYFHFAQSETDSAFPTYEIESMTVTTSAGETKAMDFVNYEASGYKVYVNGGKYEPYYTSVLTDVKEQTLVSNYRLGTAGLEDGELVFDTSFKFRKNTPDTWQPGNEWGFTFGMSDKADTTVSKGVGSVAVTYNA
ncbi:MAG: hypothetical protein K2L51_00355, partial [Clostridiales bacterium]|nr:hypothetical protein [Clostridiales bacterium]